MAARTSLRSLVDGLTNGLRRSAQAHNDRDARPQPGPTPDSTTLAGGIHPSMAPMPSYR